MVVHRSTIIHSFQLSLILSRSSFWHSVFDLCSFSSSLSNFLIEYSLIFNQYSLYWITDADGSSSTFCIGLVKINDRSPPEMVSYIWSSLSFIVYLVADLVGSCFSSSLSNKTEVINVLMSVVYTPSLHILSFWKFSALIKCIRIVFCKSKLLLNIWTKSYHN